MFSTISRFFKQVELIKLSILCFNLLICTNEELFAHSSDEIIGALNKMYGIMRIVRGVLGHQESPLNMGPFASQNFTNIHVVYKKLAK